jgi:DNA primase
MISRMNSGAPPVDLLALIGRDVTLKKKAQTHGGEWAGPCPWCGGEDRFLVWPKEDRYWCRGCERSGDAIQYVRDRHNLSFKEACERLGVPLDMWTPLAPREAPLQPPEMAIPPCPAWQTAAIAFADQCQERLWRPDGERALAWLRGRGLNDDTIQRASSLSERSACG